MRRFSFSGSMFIFIFLLTGILSAQTHFIARLTGAQEVPGVTTSATGTGVFTLTDAGLEFVITVNGITFTASHFHLGAIGVNGGVVRNITSDYSGNTAVGIWENTDAQPLTDDLIAALSAGDLYVNVHTAANPGGEIRGQVLPASGTSFSASFSGDQEVNDVSTSGMGTATFLLTNVGLAYRITLDGLTMTAAHFHNAAIGVNGGVVRTLTPDFINNTAAGILTASDSEPLTEALIDELLKGDLYVNVHTAANPGGELRGQVFINGGIGFSAMLDGNQSVPVVTTSASGTGAFTLTPAGLVYAITVNGLTPMAVHFHNAAIGVNGGPVRTLTTEFNGNTVRGVWKTSDSEPLTNDLISELLSGNIYVNVHTAAHINGEIRGQVLLNGGTSFTAKLTSAQQFSGVNSSAAGTGVFKLTSAGLEFHLTLDGITFTAAHFHKGEIGSNGNVIRTLTSDFTGSSASGIWTTGDSEPLTNSFIEDLLKNKIYVNVHTAANPGGEIRGQLIVSSGTGMMAALTGDQEPSDVTTTATGTAAFTLTEAGLSFDISYNGLTPTAAHFHKGKIGENGSVVRTLTSDFSGSRAQGLWSTTDNEVLTDALIQDLLKGNIYVNIHTSANPGGEIRGQVLLNDGWGFGAKLDGSQQSPSVATSASGAAGLSLTNSGLIFDLTVDGLNFTAAHFHNAPVGQNGGVVRGITSDFIGNTASGIWRKVDSQPLSELLIGELIHDNIYLNVHSAAHIDGEIRGNITSTSLVTGIGIVSEGYKPSSFELQQNYPNPFNPSTTIRFSVPKQSIVSLTVFDLLGRRVATLLDDYSFSTGTYEITVDASNLASGIYFYSFTAGNFKAIKKMTLVR